MKLIETKNLTKKFGSFTANNQINFAVNKGEIHALIGENGAGKSTLMNMLYGLLTPTSGEIFFEGNKVSISNPKRAIELGIGMVHQHFRLVPSLTVAENIVLGTEKIFISKRDSVEKINTLIKQYGFNLDARDRVDRLSVGKQQQVEILKMLYRDIDLLILDEPTAVLGPTEIDEFIDQLTELKEKGKTIIIITHKLGEVMKSSNRVTVIRAGEVINTLHIHETNERELARLMVGRDVEVEINKKVQVNESQNVICQINDLCLTDERGVKILDHVNLEARSGEILGIAGVEGNGQTELGYILSGLLKPESGSIMYKDKDITYASPLKIKKNGIGIIPEDRYRHGLSRDMTIFENMIAGQHHFKPYNKFQFLNKKYIKETTTTLVKQFNIKINDISENVSNLSGGNAQKIIIARELSGSKDLIIVSQPTRGVDIGSIEFIHKQLIELRNQNKAIILISNELSEIMNLSDRIAVLYRGAIKGVLNAEEATRGKLGYLMSGMEGTNDAENERVSLTNN